MTMEVQWRRTITNLPLTLVQPIRYAVEHGRRTRVRDPDHSAVPVPVDLVVQIVFVHKHQPTARRRPLRFLYVNLLTIVHLFGGDHEWHAISVENAKKKIQLLSSAQKIRRRGGALSPTYWVDTSKTWYLASRVLV